MNLRRLTPVVSQLLLIPIFSQLVAGQRSSAITLSQFQSISGFSTKCTNAYNEPIQGCTTADFASSSTPCSQECVDGLRIIQIELNNACKGTSTDPTTLIGMFFEGEGVDALCPQVKSASTTKAPASQTQDPAQGGESTTPSSRTQETNQPEPETETQTDAVRTMTMSMGTITATTSATAASPPPSDGAATPSVVATPVAAAPPSNSNPAAEVDNPESFGSGAIPFTVGESVNTSATSGAPHRIRYSQTTLAVVIGVVSWALFATL